MSSNRVDIERESNFIKFRAAHHAYDVYNIRMFGTSNNNSTIPAFDQLSEIQRHAWAAAIEVGIEVASLTSQPTPKVDSISEKEKDSGYLLYNGCKDIRKDHTSLLTYSKFPEEIKERYRELARAIYEKIDNDEMERGGGEGL